MLIQKKIGLYFFIFFVGCCFFNSISRAENNSDSSIFSNQKQSSLEIKNWKSKSDSKVFFLKTSGIPIIDVAIDVDAGSRWDPKGFEGLASFVSNLIFKGSYKDSFEDIEITEESISEFFANRAVVRSVSTSKDKTTIKLRFLNDIELQGEVGSFISKILSFPTFNSQVLNRVKTNSILRLKESLTRPQNIATKTLWNKMYPDHPYGNSITERSINSIKPEDLKNFHQQFWTPSRMTISIVGNMEKDEAMVLANKLSDFSSRKNSVLSNKIFMLPHVAYSNGSRSYISHPSKQSHIWFGMPVLARHQIDDIFPFFVANYILGGSGFGSRLTKEIREDRGLAYSVFSAFDLLKQKGPFFVGLQTGKENSEEAVSIVFETIKRFLNEGPTSEELKLAKMGLIGGFSLRLDSNAKLLANLSQIAYYNLPKNYLDIWVSRVSSVTKEDVMRVLRNTLDIEKLHLVVVGGKKVN